MVRRASHKLIRHVDWLTVSAAALVAVLIILLALLPVVVISSQLQSDTHWIVQLDPMISSSQYIESLMSDQEASERGYLISANQSSLDRFYSSRTALAALWPAAEKQAQALGGAAPGLVARVRLSATTWQTQAADVEIDDVRAGFQQDALSAAAAGRSEFLFTQFRTDSGALAAYMEELQRSQTSKRDNDLTRLRNAEGVLVVLGLMALGLLAYAGLRYITLLRRVVAAESEARFRAIVETANEGVWLLDRSARGQLANERMAELLGVELELLEERSLFDFCYPDDLPSAGQHVDQALSGHSEQFDFRLRRGDGSELLVLACTSPMKNASGQVIGAVGMYSDITARRRTEEERNALLDRLQVAHTATEAARRRLSLLADVSRGLAAAGVDMDAVLERAVREAAEIGGGSAVVRLVTDNERGLNTVAAYDPDAGRRATLEQLTSAEIGLEEGVSAVVYQTGRSILAVRGADGAFDAGLGPAHLRLLSALPAQSLLALPLRSRDRRLGTFEVFRAPTAPPYTSDDQLLLRELADRVSLAIENARLYREAVQALEVRDHFLSAISHDIRSPLTTVRGVVQLAMRRLEEEGTPAARESIGSLSLGLTAADRVNEMVDELLDLARWSEGQPPSLNRQTFDVLELVRQVAAEAGHATEYHSIVVESSEPRLVGEWDRVRLTRVLANLIGNAVKYSPDGGTVTLTVSAVHDTDDGDPALELRVRDEGVGISRADVERIFDRYHRGSNASGVVGLGIGLASVKQIVEQHGGTVRVESEEGRGSSFVVRMPLHVSQPEPV
jgi:PAS domain S-box-containing protein